PRGGKFYISPSTGKKVYVKKAPPSGPDKPKGEPKTAKPKTKKPAKEKDRPASKKEAPPAKPKADPNKPSARKVAAAKKYLTKVTDKFDGTDAEAVVVATQMKKIGAEKYFSATGSARLTRFSVEDDMTKVGARPASAGVYSAKQHSIALARRYTGLNSSDPDLPYPTKPKLGPKTSQVVIAKGMTDRQITITHEFGHTIHMYGSAKHSLAEQLRVNSMIQNDWRRAVAEGTSVSKYSQTNAWEHWAESYTAYKHRRADLRLHDRKTYDMVEDVLQSRGML